MKDLTAASHGMVEIFNKYGYGGFRVSCRIEKRPTKEEIVPSEKTEDEYYNWLRDYAIFIAEPDFSIAGVAENKYVTIEIDQTTWWEDFLNEIQLQAGQGVELQRHMGTGEIELTRRKEQL